MLKQRMELDNSGLCMHYVCNMFYDKDIHILILSIYMPN